MANKPVFFDATGRRAARISTVGWVAAVISTILFIGFVASLVISSPSGNVDLPGRSYAVNPPDLVKKAIAPGLLKSAARLAAQARNRRLENARLRRLRNQSPSRVLPGILKPLPGRSLAIGFYVNWGAAGETSFASLKRNLKQLDWVMPSWLTLDGPDLTFKITLDRRSLNYMRANKPGVAILPVLANVTSDTWNGSGLAKLLADPVRSRTLQNAIVNFIATEKLQGVTIDFEEVPPAAHKDLEAFLSSLSQSFAPHNWIIVQAAPFDDDDWPYQTYANIVDYTLLMALDQNDESSPPGPIAGEDWYEKTLDKRMRQLPADSTIVSLGNYGYDWIKGQAQATDKDFAEVMVEARDSGATISFDDPSNNPHFSFQDDDGDHEVWFLDGVTAFNQIHAADPYQPAGYAVWKLGSEDPSIFSVLGRRYNAPAPQNLATIPTNDDIDFDGEGEVLRVESGPNHRRTQASRSTSASGDIDDETYTDLPTNYVVRRVGLIPKKIALTFDDGPDPEWTPHPGYSEGKNTCRRRSSSSAQTWKPIPAWCSAILAEGHEIGNHTYTHPNLADTPVAAVRLELNATQRLFEALTGRSLRMLRPPYLGGCQTRPTPTRLCPSRKPRSLATSQLAPMPTHWTGRCCPSTR